jgi:hypothetical protein
MRDEGVPEARPTRGEAIQMRRLKERKAGMVALFALDHAQGVVPLVVRHHHDDVRASRGLSGNDRRAGHERGGAQRGKQTKSDHDSFHIVEREHLRSAASASDVGTCGATSLRRLRRLRRRARRPHQGSTHQRCHEDGT